MLEIAGIIGTLAIVVIAYTISSYEWSGWKLIKK
jgi:hypothetical protein